MTVSGEGQWLRPPSASGLTVTDGSTTVSNVNDINFTSGAVVSDGGGGQADVAVTGGGGGGGGGSSGSSGRIFASGDLTQLAGGGYAWNGMSGPQYWDDASYWHAYGGRSGGAFDASAIVAVAPVAGRYRFHFIGEGTFGGGAIRITNTHTYATMEFDTSGAPNETYSVSPALSAAANGDQIGTEVTVEVDLDVGGCIGMSSIWSSSPSSDIVLSGSYQYIELLTAASGSFSSGLLYGLSQGSTIVSAAQVTFGDTGAWPAVNTIYDTGSYWSAADKWFLIPADGYYRLFMGTTASFTSGYIGTSADGVTVFFNLSGFHPGIQPNWQPNMVGMNEVRGGLYCEDHFTAGETIQLVYENSGTHDAIWDVATFGISRSG